MLNVGSSKINELYAAGITFSSKIHVTPGHSDSSLDQRNYTNASYAIPSDTVL
ncbi:hypothetical protein K0M31_018937 [Melipona bicolor]|uniref:Uncharacterized protein n=1 Tax=Melipona bicolor TaxID=60889 RepID=A0AA40G517_9HYME|nr:hypothetical protein K0M31_018937 [Melipona bicolor]